MGHIVEVVHLVHRQGGLSFLVSEPSGISGPVVTLCGLNKGGSVFVGDGQLQWRRMGQCAGASYDSDRVRTGLNRGWVGRYCQGRRAASGTRSDANGRKRATDLPWYAGAREGDGILERNAQRRDIHSEGVCAAANNIQRGHRGCNREVRARTG